MLYLQGGGGVLVLLTDVGLADEGAGRADMIIRKGEKKKDEEEEGVERR